MDSGKKLISYIDVNVPIGFPLPLPSTDYLEKLLDLNEHVIHYPFATFYIHA
ncbi:hypothetical protein COMNV_00670 [Commensalibacter sp. Nvir]|uniref:hypothetical protein n=1 Tax=Commensalibacter sp. Nvir TaxID=3069817 RepID=UPI002D75C948|nr:hypothetical protein COMNV_00670 [Commensalibacter sp. Nvir]